MYNDITHLGEMEEKFFAGNVMCVMRKFLLAIGHIPVVTVEIPVIPADMERLKTVIPEMTAAGVNYLPNAFLNSASVGMTRFFRIFCGNSGIKHRDCFHVLFEIATGI